MKYDLIVIGGGPAGMMAAGRAGELGSRVLLLEKNRSLGLKLLVTGKGRCNITNNTDDEKQLIEKFGPNGKFLFSSLHRFGVRAVIDFFEDRGVKTKIERGGRVFPVSDRAKDVLNALVSYLKESGVKIKANARVSGFIKQGGRISKVVLADGEELAADKFILATGGKSFPGTGSTGDAYSWLEKLGHKITSLRPALTSVVVKEGFIKDLEGLSLANVEISAYQGGKKFDSRFGEAVFTANGLSGPIILDMSKSIGQRLPGEVELKIDFKPALDFTVLDKRVQDDFYALSKKSFKNGLDELLPQKLVPTMISLSGIDPLKKVGTINREERKKILHLLKEFTLSIDSLSGYEHAIITSGGAELSQIDPKTMVSKVVDNLYLAGEILDLDGPTGGYNLQVAWSTGYAAGSAAAQK